MRKLVIVALASILLLLGAALAVVFLATSAKPVALGALPPLDSVPAAAAPLSDHLPPVPSASVAAPAPLSAAAPPEDAAWAQARTVQLSDGVVAREILPPLGPCLQPAGAGSGHRATLQLRMESVAGGLQVIEARSTGGDPGMGGAVACAQEILQGRKVTFPGLPPGERYEATFDLPETVSGNPSSPPAGPADRAPARPFRRQRGK